MEDPASTTGVGERPHDDPLAEHRLSLLDVYVRHVAERIAELREAAGREIERPPLVIALAMLEEELTATRGEAGALAQELRSVAEDREALRDRVAEHELRFQELAARHQRLAEESERLREQAARMTAEHEAVAGQLEQVVGQRDDLEAQLESAREERTDLQAQLRETADEREALQERLAAAERRATDAAAQAEDAHVRLRQELRAALQQRDETAREQERTAGALQRARERQAELERSGVILARALETTHDHLLRVDESRAWRWGHWFTRTLSRMALRPSRTEGAVKAGLKTVERALQDAVPREGERLLAAPAAPAAPQVTPPAATPAAPGPDPEAVARLAGEIRERLGPVRAAATEPLVSCIVLNRNGRHHLERLLAGLREHTAYPALELIVIDNASSDDSVAWLQAQKTPFPLSVLVNDRNLSFSEANNRGAEAAGGELLLFLNNDVVPFEDGWLQEMVACMTEATAAVGATLLHPQPRPGTDWTVQHRGVRFGLYDGYLKGANVGDGEPLFDDEFGRDREYAAVTAACMLIRRTDLEQAGGFSEDYRYGTEDVELGLRLMELDRTIVCSGRAVLLHNESSTQRAEGREFMRQNRLQNRRVFLSRWAPLLRREVRIARLDGDSRWSEGAPHIVITLTSLDERDGWGDWQTGHELGSALEALGWRVTYVERRGDHWYSLPADADYVLVLLDAFDARRVPPGVMTIAWIRNWTERWVERPWFDRLDVLLASSRRSAEVIEELSGRSAEVFPLATNPERFAAQAPDPELACDYVFTGSYFDRPRAIQAAIDPREGERFLLFGKNWERTAELASYTQGPAEYERLPVIYSSARLVIDDAAEHTLPYGAVNSRVFDALAAGTLPVSNGEAGVRELFDEDFPVWSSRETLRERLDALLPDERQRSELAARYRDVVLQEHTYQRRAARLKQVVRESEEHLSFCFKVGSPTWELAPRWGDLHFALATGRELARRRHRFHIQVLQEWDDESGLLFDVVVHLRGLSRYAPRPGQFNVMWHISHPDELSGAECDQYDLVLVASDPHAEELRAATATPVEALEQATDPRVFFPDPDPAFAHDLVFVGNSRKVRRRILEDLLPTEHDLAIWGGDWDGIVDPRHVLGDFVPNEEVRRIYSSAGLVLCDHWDDMRRHGFISNRIYDALACGAVVVTDPVEGLERFGDAVVTYDDPDDLARKIERLLADRAALAERGQRGRELVLERHAFSHRVDAMLLMLQEHMQAAGYRSRIRA
jgi:GT2 family glycosyltransferase/spore maturation protein CgeB/predicted  nucleic acid-binding Zn-ribbon protein